MAGPYKSLEELDAALASKESAQPYKSIGDLDAAITQSDANDEQRLGFSAKQSLTSKPDQYIKARDLGGQFGIPPDVAERNLPEVEYRNKLDALIGTMRSSPSLGQLIQDPGYLKRTHDDIDALAQIELQTKGFRAASEFTRKALDAEVQAIFDRAWTGAKIEADIERNRPRNVFDYVGQGGSALASSLWSANSGLWGLGRAAADVAGMALPDEAAKELTGFFTRYQQATGKTAQQMLGDPNQQGFVERSIYSGLQSLGQNLLTLPAALIPGVGPGMTLGPMTAMTGGTEYGKARDKGVAVPQALIYGASQAAIEYATEVMPVTKFLGDIKAGTPFAQLLMKQVAYEIPGEQVATLLQDLNEWAVINPGKPFKSYLEERPSAAAQTLIATIVGVGGQATTVKGVETLVGAVTGQDQPFSDPLVRRAQAAQRTLEAESTITQLVDTAGQSLSISRDPSAVQELIDQADEDGQSEVFINARQFATVFNQDPVQTAAALGVDAAALNDALASNTDLVVPLSTFATAVARDQALRPIIEHTRVDPGDMSPSQARLWQSQQGEQFKSEAEAVLNKRAADEAFKAEVQQVHDRVLAELAQAKRFNQQTNEKYAAVVRDFYVTMADRAGMTVTEMAAKYPLRVVAEGTGPLSQSAQQTKTPEFKNWFGDSKIFDADGAPMVLYHATSKDFDTFIPGGENPAMSGPAIWLTTERESPPAAHNIRQVPGKPGFSYGNQSGKYTPGSNILPLYVRMEKPFYVDSEDQRQVAKDGGFNSAFPHLVDQADVDKLKAAGYDGVVLQGGMSGDEYIVFDPEQVKSAIGNRGTFDPQDANILRQSGLQDGAVALRALADEGNKQAVLAQTLVDRLGLRPEDLADVLESVSLGAEANGVGSVPSLQAVLSEVRAAALDDPKVLDAVIGSVPVDVVNNLAGSEAAAKVLLHDEAMNENSPAFNADLVVSLPVDGADTVGFLVREAALKAAEVLRVSLSPARESGEGRTAMGANDGGAFSQGDSPEPRAAFDPSTLTIILNSGADLSSFLHESGHFFLEVMADLASRPDAPAAIRKDFETTLAWFGIEASPELDAVATWNLMTLEEKRQYHEQWARGFEAYLFEGKAPSVELQGIFQRFRAWMINVYQSLKALNVELTDDVRAVFDRMLASEDAIKTAEAVRNFAPIFQTAEQAGMTAEEWAQYQDEGKQATADAVDEVQTRSIRDMRWLANAKARKIRELQATAKEVRAQVKMEVRREVLSQPLYRAWQFLTGKNPDQIAKARAAKSDPNKVDPTKDTLLIAIAKLGGLDKAQAMSEWGLDPKEKIPQVAFGKPVVRKEGGLKLDAMAEMLAQYGYLEVDQTGKWDNRQFEEMFFDALRGGEYFSAYGEEAMIAAATREAQGDPDAGITVENTPTGKLNTEMLKGMYGDKETAPWRFLSALRMTSPDGLAPDQVADLFGFTSGDDLVRSLAVAEDPRVLIEQLTDQRMLELHGDLATPGDIERAAERAIHNEVRARMLTRELNALRKAVGQGNVVLKAARQHAEAWLARQTVRNAIRHAQHVAAEGRSARAAEDALKAGDTEAAAIHKRDQLLNNQIARGALRAADEVRIAIKYLKKFEKEGTRKAIDPEYRDQIDQLLERFDLRQVSGRTLEKRASLAAWLKAQEEQGLDPVIDAALVEEAQRQHYSTLTLEEFRGLVDSIKSIEHLGRLKNHLLTAKDKRAFDAVKAELSGSIARNANRDVKTANAITPLEKGAKLLRNFSAMHRKFASIVREMDGGKDGGPMWEYLVRTMNEAGDREVTLRGEMSEKFADLFDGIKGIKLNEKVFVPDLRISLRREELLAIALNSGNDGNVQRLLDGGINESLQAITGRQLIGVLNQITDKEWDFVEGVWRMIEENRPAIAAQEKALTGVEPKWVDPTPFTLSSGRVIRGGYYPAKYNADMSTRSNELEAVTDLRQQMQGAAGRAATRKSYTEQRSKEVTGRPLRLDLGVISQHINEVTHRLAWQEWLIDARRILNATEIDRAIRDHYGPEILAQMKKQLADIAAGDNGPTDALDKVMNHIRNGTTIAGMGWNIMTSLMQPIGLTQSVERVGATWIAKGLGQYLAGNPFKVTADVHERSEFMANRAKTINREINDVLNRIRADKMSRVEASYFYLIQKFQQMVDVPTWLGAYEKAIADGNADDRAVALADQAVIDSQGGGQLKDLSAIQRGGPGQKLFTNFYSFFNTTYNRAVENARATDFSNPMQVGKLAANYLLLFTLPAVWGWALKEALRGDDDDEDAKKIAKRLAMEQLNYLLGTMVLVREIGSAISGFSGYQGPAGTRFFAELGKLIKQTEQGDVDMALVKAAANTVGIAAHLPSGQIMKSVEGTVAVMDGKAGPQAVLVGPPIKN